MNNLELQQLIQRIYKLGLTIERGQESLPDRADMLVDANLLAKWLALLTELDLQLASTEASKQTQLEIQKLADLKDRLHPQMTIQQFSYFLIPFERFLKRSLSDGELNVRTQDQTLSPRDSKLTPLVFILENLRSAFNVGSIFRLADGVGAKEVILVGYTPTPENPNVAKSALGAETVIPWSTRTTLATTVADLKAKGYWIIGMETCKESLSLSEKKWSLKPTAIIVGNERFGLETTELKLCDEILELPMYGVKNSLNVSNCLSVVAYDFRIHAHRSI